MDLEPGRGGAGGGGAVLDPEPGNADGIVGAAGAASRAGGVAAGESVVGTWVAGAVGGGAVDSAAGDIGAAGSASGSASKLVPIVNGGDDAGQPLVSGKVSAMTSLFEV